METEEQEYVDYTLTFEDKLEIIYLLLEKKKLAAVKKCKDIYTANNSFIGLKKAKEYVEGPLFDELNSMGLRQAKLTGDVIANGDNIAKEIVGFSVRDIEEPAGYMAVIYKSHIGQLAALYAITNNMIIQKVEDEFIVGHYYRFKKEVEIECIEIVKL